MIRSVVFALSLISICNVSGQDITIGECPSVTGKANFDVESFLGTWYQIKSYYPLIQSGSCPTFSYTAWDNTTFHVSTIQYLFRYIPNVVDGTATMVSTDGSAHFSVTLNVLGTFFQLDSPLWILETDYTSYAISYSCSVFGPIMKEYVYILSRTREMTEEATNAVNAFITESKGLIDPEKLYNSEQKNC